MLKYMVSMNRKMNQITRQMGEIKSDLRTRSMSPASSQSSSSEQPEQQQRRWEYKVQNTLQYEAATSRTGEHVGIQRPCV